MHPFRAAVEAQDFDAAVALLADDVTFRSPVVFKPYAGKEVVGVLLRTVSQVFEDFRYTHEMAGDDGFHSLVFEARVGDRAVEGCDFIHLDEDGRIDEMFVMVRPMSGMHALAEAMQAKLAAA